MTVPDATVKDAERYRFLRNLAMQRGDLESFVALAQLDFYADEKGFDHCVDEEMKKAKQ